MLIFTAAAATFGGVWYATGPEPAAVEGIKSASNDPFVHYRNCDAARAAGAAPMRVGEAGYREGLDGDGDGIACEPYRGGGSGKRFGRGRRGRR